MKIIGTVAGRPVTYHKGGVVRIQGTDITIYGVKDEADALRRCEINLVGFRKGGTT